MLFGLKWPNRTWMSSDNGNEQRLITFHVECRNLVLHMGHVNLPSQGVEVVVKSQMALRCTRGVVKSVRTKPLAWRVGDLAYNVTAEGCLHTPRRPDMRTAAKEAPASHESAEEGLTECASAEYHQASTCQGLKPRGPS